MRPYHSFHVVSPFHYFYDTLKCLVRLSAPLQALFAHIFTLRPHARTTIIRKTLHTRSPAKQCVRHRNVLPKNVICAASEWIFITTKTAISRCDQLGTLLLKQWLTFCLGFPCILLAMTAKTKL